MSNSAIRGEDEAVLESIRRLVSATPHHQPSGEPEPKGKLLLTPSLRIEAPEVPVGAKGHATSAALETAWSLEDRIAELEAAVGARPDEWEPDGSEDASQETPDRFVFQHRPLMLGARDAVPKSETVAPVPEDATEQADERAEKAGIDLAADETLPDEDLLRDMVAEIVRQELRGELGEKVTRNIRKLVRREIRRALASRDFD